MHTPAYRAIGVYLRLADPVLEMCRRALHERRLMVHGRILLVLLRFGGHRRRSRRMSRRGSKRRNLRGAGCCCCPPGTWIRLWLGRGRRSRVCRSSGRRESRRGAPGRRGLRGLQQLLQMRRRSRGGSACTSDHRGQRIDPGVRTVAIPGTHEIVKI